MQGSDRMRPMSKSLAALLVVPLLAMSSWASACDLSCSLKRPHSICERDGAAMPSAEPVTWPSEMAMDPTMVMPDETSVSQVDTDAPIPLHADSCTHSPCNETSASALSKSPTPHPVHALLLIGFERPTVSAISLHVTRTTVEGGPPNTRPFDPLAVSLRI